MNNQDYYNKEYVPQVNKIGKITGYPVSYTHLTLPTTPYV